jgi:drug/metabolite transporter (DMT)-like permease
MDFKTKIHGKNEEICCLFNANGVWVAHRLSERNGMNNFRAIMLMLMAMVGFTLEDMFIKKMSDGVPLGQILISLGIGAGIIFALMAKSKGHVIFEHRHWTPVFYIRAILEGVSAIAFISALSLVEISTVAAVFQVTPLAITMGAALFMGEAVGWRRWAAIVGGFIGVMIIIRPGMSAFDPNVVLVLVAVVGVAARDLITRGLPADTPATIVSFQAYMALIGAGIVMMVFRGDGFNSLDGWLSLMMIGAIFCGVVGYYGIVTAMRTGETSVIMPFRYMRLVFSLIVGFFIFHERPDMWTLLGAAIVIAMGIFTVWRERAAAQKA